MLPALIDLLENYSEQYSVLEGLWHDYITEELQERKMIDKNIPPGMWAYLKSMETGRKLQNKMGKVKLAVWRLMMENNLTVQQLPENLR